MKQRDEVIEEPDARTGDELVRRIAPTRAALDSLVDGLTDETLLRPHQEGGWPVIGHLTHIAAWERMIIAHVTDGADHEVVSMTPAEYERATLDELNARIYLMHERDAVVSVLSEFVKAHAAIVRCIETLAPEQLAQPYWPGEGRTVANKIAGDTYLHYAEHRGWILEMVGGSG